jgi:hypothetical protein
MGHFKDSKWSLCTKSRFIEGLSLVPFKGPKKSSYLEGGELQGEEIVINPAL